MLNAILNYLRRHERTAINRELDHVYADMRKAKAKTRLLKLHADQQEADELTELAKQEVQLIAKAKRIDAQDTFRSIPTRSARAW